MQFRRLILRRVLTTTPQNDPETIAKLLGEPFTAYQPIREIVAICELTGGTSLSQAACFNR